jgi:hypothetical protein
MRVALRARDYGRNRLAHHSLGDQGLDLVARDRSFRHRSARDLRVLLEHPVRA